VEAARWTTSTPPGPAEGVVDDGRQRVLIADDNADMREYLARLLSPHWNVDRVADGQAALDAAIARRPDLILSDVMMPGMDGVTLLRAVRGDRRIATTPVVLLSARAGEEEILEGIDMLADDYLVKPFSARELVTRVRTHLRMARIRETFQAQLIVADRMSAVGTLAAGVAHEINNPLAYVLSNLELLAAEVRALLGDTASSRATELDQMFCDARQGAQRIQKIVSGMKTFSRTDEDTRVPLDVHPLIELSIDLTLNEVSHRARIVKDFGAIPLVDANDARLRQVFMNLLLNAAHAIPEGHAETNEIRLVTGTDASGHAVIEVRDTGRGMPLDVLKHVFDPFFTTKPIGQGTGLGLSVCHSVVQGLGGEITVESEPGSGSVLRITLPASQVKRPALAPVKSTANSAPTHSGRILVIDDDLKVGEVLQRILGKEHEVTVLTGGQAALDLLSGGRTFDVILCDLMMPHLTGMDIFAALSDALPEVVDRMVFLTGGAFSPDTRHFLATVPNQCLDKPFSPQNLRAMVRSFIQDRRERIGQAVECCQEREVPAAAGLA
jgi:signal transduction histidine kinase